MRVTLAVFMRDRNPLVYGPSDALLDGLPDAARAALGQSFFAPTLSVDEQIARVEAIAAAVGEPEFQRPVRPERRAMVLGRTHRAESPRRARAPGGACICIFWRRAISAPSPTRHYPEGVAARLEALGLMSPRLTLAHCVYARDGGARRDRPHTA